MTAMGGSLPGPEQGELLFDARRERVGEVVGSSQGRVTLRSPAGGQRWEAYLCDVRPATAQDALRARVAAANYQSRNATSGNAVLVRSVCEECLDIKRRRAEAPAAGDRGVAMAMTEAMGVHLRVAHP